MISTINLSNIIQPTVYMESPIQYKSVVIDVFDIFYHLASNSSKDVHHSFANKLSDIISLFPSASGAKKIFVISNTIMRSSIYTESKINSKFWEKKLPLIPMITSFILNNYKDSVLVDNDPSVIDKVISKKEPNLIISHDYEWAGYLVHKDSRWYNMERSYNESEFYDEYETDAVIPTLRLRKAIVGRTNLYGGLKPTVGFSKRSLSMILQNCSDPSELRKLAYRLECLNGAEQSYLKANSQDIRMNYHMLNALDPFKVEATPINCSDNSKKSRYWNYLFSISTPPILMKESIIPEEH
jgi:hypothetical protein